jgi:hypothetical protein
MEPSACWEYNECSFEPQGLSHHLTEGGRGGKGRYPAHQVLYYKSAYQVPIAGSQLIPQDTQ